MMMLVISRAMMTWQEKAHPLVTTSLLLSTAVAHLHNAHPHNPSLFYHQQRHFPNSEEKILTRESASLCRCTGSGSPRCRRRGRCKCCQTRLSTCLALSAPEAAHWTMKGIQNQPARKCQYSDFLTKYHNFHPIQYR